MEDEGYSSRVEKACEGLVMTTVGMAIEGD